MSESKKDDTKLTINLNFKDMLDLFKNSIIKRQGFLVALETKLEEKVMERVQKGELSEKQAREQMEQINSKIDGVFEKFSDKVDSGIERTLKTLRIASVSELQQIEVKLDALNARLDELLDKAAGSAEKKTARKASRKKKETGGKTVKSTGTRGKKKQAETKRSRNAKDAGKKTAS